MGVVAPAAGDLRVEPVDVRTPGPDEALVQVAYGFVCGSDLRYWRHGAAGESILRAPMLLGHEIVGTVLAPAAVAWHAIACGGDVAGKIAMVVGCGPIGALAVGVLKRAGAAEIVAVDVHDTPLAIARAVGATRTVN